MLFRLIAVSVLATALVAAGCASDKADEPDSGPSGPTTTYDIPADEIISKVGEPTVTISSLDNILEPRYVEITEGTRVVFVNDGRNAHDLVPAVEGAFEGIGQAEFGPGASHIVVFDEPGDFPYFCSVHGTMKHGMNGAIRVVPKK